MSLTGPQSNVQKQVTLHKVQRTNKIQNPRTSKLTELEKKQLQSRTGSGKLEDLGEAG